MEMRAVENMEKVKKLLRELGEQKPIIKTFGKVGVLVYVIFMICQPIVQSEIVNAWNRCKDTVAKAIEAGSNYRKNVFVAKDKMTASPQITKVIDNRSDKKTIADIMEGKICGDGDERREYFIPEETGMHRFDFDTNDVNVEYRFYIYDTKNDIVDSAYSSQEGISVYLEKEEKYTLEVSCEEEGEEVQYSVSIHSPKPISDINDNIITNKIDYTDQEDFYTYTASTTGIYRFDFDINDVNLEYSFSLYDHKNSEMLSQYCSDDGGTVELTEGETYKIKIAQKEGNPEYTIEISVPNRPQEVDDNFISGEIRYTDQVDVYRYCAPRTGIYRLTYDIEDVNKEYNCVVLTKKGEELSDAKSSYEGTTLNLEKDQEYEIHICQSSGYAKYEMEIHVPQEEKKIKNGIIVGKISYIDQKNIYYYQADKNGIVTLKFNTDNLENIYRIEVYDRKNKNMLDVKSSSGEEEIRLEKGEIYMVCVSYYEGYEKYKIVFKVER